MTGPPALGHEVASVSWSEQIEKAPASMVHLALQPKIGEKCRPGALIQQPDPVNDRARPPRAAPPPVGAPARELPYEAPSFAPTPTPRGHSS